MMTNVTEIETDKHMKMNYIEFQDAFGKIADKMTIDENDNLPDI